MVLSTKIENNSLPAPEQESDFQCDSHLGYEPDNPFGYVRCITHGAPHPLIRWHCHEEYELHLLLETSGKMFVGDYIGRFEPGNLVLLGPFVPHSWASYDVPEEGVAKRDFAIQFTDEPIRYASKLIPELRDALGLLELAKQGVEFVNVGQIVYKSMISIQESTGLKRFSEFINLLSILSTHTEYRLLSSMQPKRTENNMPSAKISDVVDYITKNYSKSITMSEIADRCNMHKSRFSRYFRRATGNNFTDFVNRLRINRSCQLLMETDDYISTVCYKVGYHNVANFNRRFMAIKGMTPSEFRRRGTARFIS